MRRRSGFTLIELLVVIAIIAILAAILFPIFTRAKTTAKLAKCISNLKQIGTAMALYVDDNNGKYPSQTAGATPPGFPPGGGIASVSPGVAGLAWTLSRYSKSSGIWMCPSGAVLKRVPGPGGLVISNVYTYPVGFTTADLGVLVGWAWGAGTPDISTNYGSWALNRGLNSAQYDCANGKTPADFYTTWRNNWARSADRVNPAWACGRLIFDMYSAYKFFPHRGGSNILYYDGRASWLPDTRRTIKDL